MPITRLNHVFLYVRDAQRSAAWYDEVLGFRRISTKFGGAAVFLQAPASTNDHDLGVASIGDTAAESLAGSGVVGLYHLAWEIDTLAELERVAGRLRARDAFVDASDHGTTKSVYARDPDGFELEIAWVVPADRLDAATLAAQHSNAPLDLEKEKARYGADTLGGVWIGHVSPTSSRGGPC